MTILSVHQPQYLPWLGYFDKIARSDAFVFLDNVQYKEREFQNRNKIRTSGGWIWLTVPVLSAGQGRQKIRDVRIDNAQSWRASHWRSLMTWYAKAPGFRAHEEFFARTYERQWMYLCELNVHITMYLLKAFAIATPVRFETEYAPRSTRTSRIVELCGKLGADTYLSGSGGRDYLEEALFETAGIALEYQSFRHPVYRQQFQQDSEAFTPYMSAIDMLFNSDSKSFNFNILHSYSNDSFQASVREKTAVASGEAQ